MLQELCFIHSRLSADECMKIILTRNNWEIYSDKTDIVGVFNDCFRIVRKNGRIVSINPDQVAAICMMTKAQGIGGV